MWHGHAHEWVVKEHRTRVACSLCTPCYSLAIYLDVVKDTAHNILRLSVCDFTDCVNRQNSNLLRGLAALLTMLGIGKHAWDLVRSYKSLNEIYYTVRINRKRPPNETCARKIGGGRKAWSRRQRKRWQKRCIRCSRSNGRYGFNGRIMMHVVAYILCVIFLLASHGADIGYTGIYVVVVGNVWNTPSRLKDTVGNNWVDLAERDLERRSGGTSVYSYSRRRRRKVAMCGRMNMYGSEGPFGPATGDLQACGSADNCHNQGRRDRAPRLMSREGLLEIDKGDEHRAWERIEKSTNKLVCVLWGRSEGNQHFVRKTVTAVE